MSRSRKKHPIVKDCISGGKKEANRKVRRTLNVPNGKAYRKVYDSWNISDWRFYRNPKPHYRTNFNGEIIKIDPEPEWRVRMK
jgi:hypothetical protein